MERSLLQRIVAGQKFWPKTPAKNSLDYVKFTPT